MAANDVAAPPESPYLDDAGVEREFGIRRTTLRTWRSRGGGPPYIRLSDRMSRYRRADLEAWLDARKVAP